MKIVTLSNCPLVESQGSGYVVLNYVRELRARGHNVHCVGPDCFELLPRFRAARQWRLSIGMAIFVLRRKLFSDADLIEFYGAESWMAVLLLRMLRTRASLVHHSNGLETRISAELIAHSGADTHSGRPRRWYQFRGHKLLKQAFTRVDALVLVSQIEATYAHRMRYQQPDRVLTLETPLPPNFLNLPAPEARPFTVGYCGGWFARKGVDIVREALIELLRRHPGLEVRLAGVGTGFLKEVMFPPDVSARVFVSPFIADKAELRNWYAQVAIFLMPSYSESFGLVVSEAMACGCAVVASNTGFAAALQHQVEAMLIDGYATSDFIAAADMLLRDDTLRQRIALRGYERVQRLRWPEAGTALSRFYDSLARFDARDHLENAV